jgi:hypothetical protein
MYIVERETLRHVVYQPFRDIVEREALRHVVHKVNDVSDETLCE